MHRKIISGYLVKDILSIQDIENILLMMRSIVNKRAGLAYKSLITRQIERIVDEIALNQWQRPENESILDIADGETKRRILYADQHGQPTEYNLYMGVQTMIGKYDGKPTVFFKTTVPNDIYSKELKKIPELIPFDLYSSDVENKSSKQELWNSLCEKYGTDIPFMTNLLIYDDLVMPDLDTLKFKSPIERAAERAQEKVLNHFLALYARNQEIPPHKLMEYTLQAMERLTKPVGRDMVESEKEKLISILPAITVEMLLTKGIDPLLKSPLAQDECAGTDNHTVSDSCK